MDKNYNPTQFEPIISALWDKEKLFEGKVDNAKEPFCIIFPPPNANGSLHVGHACYVYQDIMIRYAKLTGKNTFWVFGTDHAGTETQFVFEKELKKQGKSRFDYDRATLYSMIEEFVAKSQGTMKTQLKSMGFGLDFSREQYTLDPNIVRMVQQTFKKMFEEGLVYRANRLVNYCTSCGTGYSDLETESEETIGKLYYIDYPIKDLPAEFITVATTRPETLLADVAVMVNPEDSRFKKLVGKTVLLPLANREIPIIADSYVDAQFGTGAVKVTPAHDFNDFEVGKRHKLWHDATINFIGKINGTNTEFDGLRVKAGREAVVAKLQELSLLRKVEDHKMVVKVCYKCKRVLEPLPLPQWYISIKPLREKALALIETGETTIFPKRFKNIIERILTDFIDWNISRQIVWGIRIPAFFHEQKNEWIVEVDPKKQEELLESGYMQDEDTFDTWFSSGQWPFVTLKNIGEAFFEHFYSTAVMETGYDIARAWVARMMMMGVYATGKTPFKTVYLHGLVRDGKGQKMSKSKGNVVNPLDLTAKYGTDALRAALVFETAPGADLVVSEEKVKGMRNFANKIWNMGRFIQFPQSVDQNNEPLSEEKKLLLAELEKEAAQIRKDYQKSMEAMQYSQAFGILYEFLWHRLADSYIEALKEEVRCGKIEVLNKMKTTYLEMLKLLHPFMPFITEAIFQELDSEKKLILAS